jgi:high-affinity Fe2+/Pb2+ permease
MGTDITGIWQPTLLFLAIASLLTGALVNNKNNRLNWQIFFTALGLLMFTLYFGSMFGGVRLTPSH